MASWYEGIADRYLDLFVMYDHKGFRERLKQEHTRLRTAGLTRKQLAASDWDAEILGWAERQLGEPVTQLHPGLVHRYRKFIGTLPSFTWDAKPGREALRLPERYAVMRFYRNRVFSGEGAERFAAKMAAKLAKHMPVVSLNTEMVIDTQHPDFRGSEAVIDLSSQMTFRNNLAVQSAAMANAEVFVGTYGGLSYVPPRYGVPSHCYWNDPGGIVPAHLKIARRSFGEEFHARPANRLSDALREILASCPAPN